MLTEFRSIQDVWEQLPTEADARRFLEGRSSGERCRSARTARPRAPGRSRASRRAPASISAAHADASSRSRRRLLSTPRSSSCGSGSPRCSSSSPPARASPRSFWPNSSASARRPAGRWATPSARWTRERRGSRRSFTGIVEVDEAFVGGKPKYRRGVKNKRGKGTKKPQILVAVQRNGEARAIKIKNAQAKTIHPSGEGVGQPLGSSDDRCCACLQVAWAIVRLHHAVNHSRKQFVDKATGAHINTAEAFAGQVERAMVGVYHILFPEHLQRYLNRIAWRWNRRELVRIIRGPNSSRKHRIWEPVRVVAHMVELLQNAPGRQVRRAPIRPPVARIGGVRGFVWWIGGKQNHVGPGRGACGVGEVLCGAQQDGEWRQQRDGRVLVA